MKLYRTAAGIAVEAEGKPYLLQENNWDACINRDGLHAWLQAEIRELTPLDGNWLAAQSILAPIQSQEVWAAGVTYLRSRNARMEESKEAGGDTFYDKVYIAGRPEIFFKATAQRTVGPGGTVRIRRDSTWDVPEPELTLFITTAGQIAGYTIGNDMSSRSIEGENPLYLPQAKTYEGCAALGPCLYVPEKPIDPDAEITLEIIRAGQPVFRESIAISRMKRRHTELVEFLYRECAFPHGCFLMTGTGIVPAHPFTLQSRDEIAITITHIGTLRNTVG